MATVPKWSESLKKNRFLSEGGNKKKRKRFVFEMIFRVILGNKPKALFPKKVKKNEEKEKKKSVSFVLKQF